jgi:hypothetical protein
LSGAFYFTTGTGYGPLNFLLLKYYPMYK